MTWKDHHIEEVERFNTMIWTRVGGNLAKSQAFWKVRFTAFRYKAAFTLFRYKGNCAQADQTEGVYTINR